MIQKCEKCSAHAHTPAPAPAPAPTVKGMADVFGGQTVAQYKAQKAASAATCGCGGAKVSEDGICPCMRRVPAGSAGSPYDYSLQKAACACNRDRW